MDAGVVFPAEGMNKEVPARVSIPTSGDVTASINRPSLADSGVEDVIESETAPLLGSPEEQGRFTSASKRGDSGEGLGSDNAGMRPSDMAFSDTNTGSDLGLGIQISDLPLGEGRQRDSMASDISVAGSSYKEGGDMSVSQSTDQMDTSVPSEGVPTGASGFGAGTKNLSQFNDPGIGGIQSDFASSANPPFIPAGLPTGVDPARDTFADIPTGASDVFEPRPDDEEAFDQTASYLRGGGIPGFEGSGLQSSDTGLDMDFGQNVSTQGSFQTHSTYKDIPVPTGDPASALPPEAIQTLISPILQSLNQAGAPRAHIQHVEQVIYSADDVPGIGHVEGTIERVTTVDQTPDMPNIVQSQFRKPSEQESFGPRMSNTRSVRGD